MENYFSLLALTFLTIILLVEHLSDNMLFAAQIDNGECQPEREPLTGRHLHWSEGKQEKLNPRGVIHDLLRGSYVMFGMS